MTTLEYIAIIVMVLFLGTLIILVVQESREMRYFKESLDYLRSLMAKNSAAGSQSNADAGASQETHDADDASEVISATEKNVELLVETLTRMGCQPRRDKENPLVFFNYQGEAFSIRMSGSFARIWDLPFSEVPQHDLKLPHILEAINQVNFNLG